MGELDPWPGYDDQSWQQRYATLRALHSELLEHAASALGGQIERASKAESVNADLLEALKDSTRTMSVAIETLQRGLPRATAVRKLSIRINANDAAISRANQENGK